jgi:hypothetical protein
MPANNGFGVNGLYEIEVEESSSVWSLAGTLVPISDTMRERKAYSEKKSP